jgi:hypothetical protein
VTIPRDEPLDDQARERIRTAAVAFVEESIGRLQEAHALPLSGRKTPWLDHNRVWNILGRDVGKGLITVLETELPARFAPLVPLPRAEAYPMALLRGVVTVATVQGLGPADASPIVFDLVDEMVRLVEVPDQTIRSIRLLSHIDVSPVAGQVVAGVRFQRVRGLRETVAKELPEATYEIDRTHVSLGSRQPRALIVSEASGPQDSWQLANDLRPRLQYVVSALRLLTGATIGQLVEVYGQPTMVHPIGPSALELDPEAGTYWRRVGVLEPADLAGVGRLVELLTELDALPPKKLPSIVVAIGRFNRSYRPAAWQDSVVDLAIGLEAALSDDSDRDLTLALRSRAAHLLAMPDDPAAAIFRDVGDLYTFRSGVVHGTVVGEPEWTKLFERRGIRQILPSDRLETAMDRWRDLLRRAILARLLLGQANGRRNVAWPLKGAQVSIDGQLVDPGGRRVWRAHIRRHAASLGIARAWRRAEPLHDFLHEPWSDDLSN